MLDTQHPIDQSVIEVFEAKLVEATTAPWMFWFGLLATYQKTHSNVLVSKRYKTSDGFKLGTSAGLQRFQKDKIPAEQ